jgi:hypothetical protein
MDAELPELQRQIEVVQSAQSRVRLLEWSCWIHKLQERNLTDFELLHTDSGKHASHQ